MSAQLQLFDRESLWEMGIAEKCVRGRGDCRYQPCTVAQGVRCCAACMKCVKPCDKAGKEKHGRVRR